MVKRSLLFVDPALVGLQTTFRRLGTFFDLAVETGNHKTSQFSASLPLSVFQTTVDHVKGVYFVLDQCPYVYTQVSEDWERNDQVSGIHLVVRD